MCRMNDGKKTGGREVIVNNWIQGNKIMKYEDI